MAGIWVFAEGRDQTLELLGAGRDIADKQSAKVAAFATGSELAREYIECGADMVFQFPALAQDQPLESFVPVISDIAKELSPDVFLIGGTTRGKEIAARVATRLNTGLCSSCIGFKLDAKGKLLMDRLVYGGAGVQTVVCTGSPQMATVPPRTFEAAQPQAGRSGEIRELPPAPASPVKIVGRAPKQKGAVDITEAKIIVCVGRGLAQKEDIEVGRQLAKALGGEVACSRPIAEELQWLPEDLYLGISGKKVKPALYIGLGVSGQVQHITGIRDSKVIFAVNRDENAPIFEAADYGIVGDLYTVVPMLIEELKTAIKA
jgi:electron transfer flavoprotein alpha subunit